MKNNKKNITSLRSFKMKEFRKSIDDYFGTSQKSISSSKETFTVVWKYTSNGNIYDLGGNITPSFNNSPFTIIPQVSPSDATFDISGNSTVLNVSDGKAQLTLTGTGNFTGAVLSPSIQVSQATFTAEWQYTNDNGQTYTDLTKDSSFNYTSLTYAISMKSVNPSYATFITSGNSTVKNVADGTAQLTLTGTGNFTGAVLSPFIKVYPATFSVVWKYTNDSSIFDLSNNITPHFNNSSFNIAYQLSPSNASVSPSGNSTVKNVADGTAQLTLTGTGNFTGTIISPSIQVSQATFTAEWQYTIDNGQTYTDLTKDSSLYYTSLTYAISMKSVTPSYATFNTSGNSTVLNVSDGKAQLTLTGTGNFTDQVTSPSIQVSPAMFTVVWKYTNNGNTYDLGGNITPSFNNSPFTITYQLSPSDATFDISGNSTVLNVSDGKAQLTLTGTDNFIGSIISPSITVI
jgi:hypothetical protein